MGDVSKESGLRAPFGELRPLAAALTLGFGLSLAPTTYAATFTVTNLNNAGAGSLRDAVTQANSAPGADTINFTVTGTIALTSQIEISDDVTITGPGAASLTVSPTGSDRVFYIDDDNPTVTISGVTIQRASGSTDGNGGAIYNYSGNLTIQNSVISGNSTNGKGGAIYNYGGTVNIVNSSLTGNTALAGGAIYSRDGSINITNSTLSGNAATYSGGALYARYGGVTVTNSTFSGNTAGIDGGGISTSYASVTLTNSTFSGNVATSGVGGAVALYNTTLSLVSTILANSTASGGTADLGEFSLYYYQPPEATKGVKKPGRHFVNHTHHPATTKVGHGVHASAKAKTVKTHPARPHTAAKSHPNGIPHTSGTVNATHSLIENDGGFLNGSNVNNILGQDPALGPLANNGGTTLTHALLPGSPAIDKGSNPNVLAFDQRGSPFARTAGAQTDIGAFEVQGSLPPVQPLDVPTLSQWSTVMLSGLLGVWAVITGFGRRRRPDDN